MTCAASMFPCSSCETPKKDFKTCEQTGKTRTISDLAHDYERFLNDKAERQPGKHYHAVVNQPLFLKL